MQIKWNAIAPSGSTPKETTQRPKKILRRLPVCTALYTTLFVLRIVTIFILLDKSFPNDWFFGWTGYRVRVCRF